MNCMTNQAVRNFYSEKMIFQFFQNIQRFVSFMKVMSKKTTAALQVLNISLVCLLGAYVSMYLLLLYWMHMDL